MFILYFALWVILNGKWTTEIGLFGLAFAAVAYVFSCKFMGYKLSLDLALLSRVPHALRYCMTLFREIVNANLTVIRMILDREFEPQPQLVQFDVDLVKDRHRVTLANSITLTPGTITVSLDENHYVVHCLDKSLVDGLDDGAMPTMLVEMERKHIAQDSAKQNRKAQVAEVESSAAQEDSAREAAQPITEQGCDEAAAPDEPNEDTAEEMNEETAEATAEEVKEDEHEH